MNASYDILQAIMCKPPVAEVDAPKRTRKQTSRDDKLVLEVIKKLSADDLQRLLSRSQK